MPSFSQRSRDELGTCHPDLIKLFSEVVKYYDCSVICGYRDKEAQDIAFHDGKSKLQYPHSPHNSYPSNAADVVPCPIDWNDRVKFVHFAGFVQATAKQLGIKIRWGGDWTQDNNLKNDSFVDLPHFELVEEKL
jgi:peptidoglycan L-alanyl-D-glutamate endopeptidase CwlK